MSAGVDAGTVLAALADPTRRQILVRLAEGARATATELARDLPMSRQAVSRHLATLRRAHLVSDQRAGREARYVLEPAGLRAAEAWIEQVTARWEGRLDRWADLAEAAEADAD